MQIESNLPGTTITYALPKAANVRLAIFNLRGQVVRTLVDEQQPAGLHRVQWDGRSDAGAALTSGVYVYRMKAEGFTQSRKRSDANRTGFSHSPFLSAPQELVEHLISF